LRTGRPPPDGQDVEHRRDLPGDPDTDHPPARRRMPGGRDGSGGAVRRRPLPRRPARLPALRRRFTGRRHLGRPPLATSRTPRGALLVERRSLSAALSRPGSADVWDGAEVRPVVIGALSGPSAQRVVLGTAPELPG